MSAGRSACLCWTLLSVCLLASSSPVKRAIRAEPGQTVSLPCKALNNDPVTVVDWRRTDLMQDESVLLYRNKKLDPEYQHPSYKNRVDLQDRQMKDGDVSLILKNVKIEDRGTYECYVVQNKTNQKRSIIRLVVVPVKRAIRAEPGQTVSLPCKALNNDNVTVLEWRRTDPKPEEYVLIYCDDQRSIPVDQHPSYKNRVDLQDRQMKDGDVSLSLNNVTIEDRGTYECRVETKINRRKRANLDSDPISIIRLEVVVPPGHTDEHKEGGDKDGGDKDGSVGLIVGLIVPGLLLLLGVAGFLIFRRYKHRYRPPPE